jgi:hypothetical protein
MLERTDSVHGYPFIFSGPEAAINDAPKTASEANAKRLIRSFQNVLELSASDISCSLPICAGHKHLYRNSQSFEQSKVKPIAPLPITSTEAERANAGFC